MKVSINLATLSSSRERYALVWAAPLALLGAGVFVFLCYVGVQSVREYHKIASNLNEMTQQEHALQDREAALRKELDQPRDRQVFQKAQYVNSLIDRKKLALTQVTLKVAELMPPTVRLSSMGFSNQKEGSLVHFAVVGQSEDDLEAFLGSLEDSADFTGLTISPQGFQPSTAPGAPVAISCTARYVGEGAN
jgi:hypothetical protein